MKIMSPLRWKILAGYALFAAITVFLWKDLATGVTLIMTVLTPISAFFAALLALNFGVAIAALGTLFLVFLKSAIGLLIAVSKVGIIKGLFLPWLLSGLQWLHKKSEFLQKWIGKAFRRGKTIANNLYSWWKSQHVIDRFLLMGFLGPLILVISFAIVVQRFVYLFISKKAAEQLVQKTTKGVVRYFHKIPVIGKIPAILAAKADNLKIERDRKIELIRNAMKKNRLTKQ